jgi:hypothetical protein
VCCVNNPEVYGGRSPWTAPGPLTRPNLTWGRITAQGSRPQQVSRPFSICVALHLAQTQTYGVLYGTMSQQANLKACVDMFAWTVESITEQPGTNT